MLQTFLKSNREELISRCRAKVEKRSTPLKSEELAHGIPTLLTQIGDILRAEEGNSDLGKSAIPWESDGAATDIGTTAMNHGNELMRLGFSVEQVVHCYGDLCQAVTELAMERKAQIPTNEFHILNRCLDNAIASAVSEFGRERDRIVAGANTRVDMKRAFLHRERKLLQTVVLCVEAIKRGHVGIYGSTGAILDAALKELQDLTSSALDADGPGSDATRK